jgi:hypothetical protein
MKSLDTPCMEMWEGREGRCSLVWPIQTVNRKLDFFIIYIRKAKFEL